VLIRLTDVDALMLVVVHHVVFDGGSVGVLFRELASIHDALREGVAPALPQLRVQLADYATWERRELNEARIAPILSYWREYLADAPSAVELPTDLPRASGATGEGARHASTLDRTVLQAVRDLGARHGVTTFVVLVAAFQSLIHRYTDQPDVIIGTAVAGRSRPGTEGLVGYLANTLPLRARFDDATTFAELLGRMRQDVLSAFEHQDVPYEMLVRDLRRSSAEQALFRMMFTLQDSSSVTPMLGAARLEPVGVDLGAAKFDLTMSAAELPDGIRVAVEYRRDLFHADTIARLAGHLGEFLRAAAATPGLPVSRLSFLTREEQHRLLVDWNRTDARWPRGATLHALFEEQVERRPTAIAVECGTDRLTYAELDRKANRLAWRLRARGVVPDTLVAVCMEKSVDVVATLLGILKAGGAYVPMDPAYPDDRLEFMLEDCEARLLITDRALEARVAPLGTDVLVAADAWAESPDARDEAPPPSATTSNLCYVIYTSGSTGRPKGVLVEHGNVVRLLFNDRLQFQFDERDVWSLFHSFSFDFSVWEMYGALLLGGRLVVVPRDVAQQPAEFLALLASRGVTVLNQVPSAFYALMQEERNRDASALNMRYVIFGGEALQPALLREWKARHPQTTLVNMFGITETTVHVTYKEIGDAEIANGASNIGGPIPTLTTYVLDRHMQLVPIGVTGEVCVGGAGVARGYLNRPELTAERFVPHPFRAGERMYRSGDVGRMRANGEMEYLGRRDAQVKLRGFRIELGEIETTIAQHPSIAGCVAVLRNDGLIGPRLVAYYVPNAMEPRLDRAALRAWAAERLPEFMVPSVFVALSTLPLTSNGKVDRKALPAPDDAADADVVVVSPRNELETVIAGVWSDMLGIQSIGVETSFFELGGHSLLATRINAQVSRIFRSTLALRRFFENPTVAGTARVLMEIEPKPGQTASIARLYLKAKQMSPEERERLRAAGPRHDQTTTS
jgi:amino acid adenylation domain-containing protein